MEYNIGGWRLDLDPEATRSWYESAPVWDCDCGHCRNFLAQADRAIPEKLSGLME